MQIILASQSRRQELLKRGSNFYDCTSRHRMKLLAKTAYQQNMAQMAAQKQRL